jgi:FkbM family methyltransferase
MTTIAQNKYGRYSVPASSLQTSPPAKHIMEGRVYEPKTIEFIIEHCGMGDIVHAGTYFGDFLPALSSAITPSAKIWAYEPKHEHYVCARETLALNNIDNVLLTHAGLGKEYSLEKLTTIKQDGTVWGGGSRIEPSSNGQTEDINIVPIDSEVPKSRDISLIHLDVEGFETEALMGAINTIQRCKPILIVETIPDNSWMRTHLFNLGYRIDSQKLHRNSVLRIT